MFYMENIREKIFRLAGSVTEAYGVDIADIEIAGSVRRQIVRLFIDKDGGVSLDDCEKISRALSAVLDIEDPIRGSYVLEVSSPGLDRPLKTLSDFEKHVGKLVRIITKESVNKQNFFVGRIKGTNGNLITMMIDGTQEFEIPFEQISKSRLEIEFK